MKITIRIFRLIGMVLALALTFLIGFVDRAILVFMPWKTMPSIFTEKYYRHAFEASYIRVFVLGAILGVIYICKYLINALF